MRFLHSGLMGCLTLFIAYSTFLLPFLTGEIFVFFQGEDGIRYGTVTGVQTCALPIYIGERKKALSLRGLFRFSRSSAARFKTLDSSRGVYDFFSTRKEGVAHAADFN